MSGPPSPPSGWVSPPDQGWGTTDPQGWYPPPAQGWAPPPPAPKPGVIPLRPLGVGDVLEATLATLRRYPAATLGSSLLVVAVVSTLQLVLLWPVISALADLPEPVVVQQGLDAWWQALESFPWQWALVAGVLAGMLSFLLLTSLTGLLAVVVGQAVLGRTLSFGQAWRRAAPRLPRLLVTVLLVALAVSAIWLVLAGLALVAVAASAPTVVAALLLLAALAALPASLWLGVRLALASPAVMLESQDGRAIGPAAAVRRSWRLVGGAWWRTFGVVLLGSVIAGALSGLVSAPVQALVAAAPLSLGAGLVLTTLGAVVGQAVSLPISGLVLALVYVDRRIRAEGLDTALAHAAGVAGPQ